MTLETYLRSWEAIVRQGRHSARACCSEGGRAPLGGLHPSVMAMDLTPGAGGTVRRPRGAAKRAQKIMEKTLAEAPLPACYEERQGGFRKIRGSPNSLTKYWRVNVNTVMAGAEQVVEFTRPSAPSAYSLPKVVLERFPDEPLNSAPYIALFFEVGRSS